MVMNANVMCGTAMSKFLTFLLQYELKCLRQPMNDEFRSTKWAFLSKTSWLGIVLERVQEDYRAADVNQFGIPSIESEFGHLHILRSPQGID